MGSRPAFTLIDLLLTMGIIGALSSIVLAAVNPEAQLSAAHDAQRRVVARAETDAIRDIQISVGGLPGSRPLSTLPQEICRYGVIDPDCINMDELVEGGYLNALAVDVSETDPALTGYTVALQGDFPVVTAKYLGQGTGPAASSTCDVSFTPALFVDGNGANGINNNVSNNASFVQFATVGSTLYAGWQEGQPAQVRVASYNNNDSSPAWSFVDGNGVNGINKNPTKSATNVQFTSFNGKLYAVWIEVNASFVGQVRVAVYSGGTWSFVDGDGADGINKDTLRSGFTPQLTVFSSNLYATWYELNASGQYEIRVAVYSGDDGAPAWTFVDGNGEDGINKDPAQPGTAPQLTVYNDKLYATWYEANGSGINQIRVAVYDGNAPSSSPPNILWLFVDGDGADGLNKSVAHPATSPQLTVADDKLYLTWVEQNNAGISYLTHVAVYNGDDDAPAWSIVDGGSSLNKDADGHAQFSQLLVFDNDLYATWGESVGASPSQVRLAAYNGNDSAPSWTFIDGNGANGINKNVAKGAIGAQIVDFNDHLYVIWHEANASNILQIRAARNENCQ